MDDGAPRLDVAPLLHFHDYVKITAMDVHPHDQLCAVATSDGHIYTVSGRLVAELARGGGGDSAPLAAALSGRELHAAAVKGIEHVARLQQPASQLVWARWKSTRMLGAIAGSRAVRLFTYGTDGAWKECEHADVPESNNIAFSPARHELACACSGGRVVVVKRTNDVWSTRWTEAPEGTARVSSRRDTLCVSWSDSGLLAVGDNDGQVRVLSTFRQPPQSTVLLSSKLDAAVHHVAFAPSIARSFLLLAAATHDTVMVLAFAAPPEEPRETPTSSALGGSSYSTDSFGGGPPVTVAQRKGALGDGAAALLGMATLRLKEMEMTSRLRWNSLGNTLCCSLVDGAVQMFRLKISYRLRPAVSDTASNTLELELEDIGAALAPFHYDQLIDL